MKSIIHISLGAGCDDFDFKTSFLGQPFHLQRFGTDGDLEKATGLLLKWNRKADAIALGSIKLPHTIGTGDRPEKETEELQKLASQMQTPVTTGAALRTVVHEWAIRHLQFKLGNNYFNNARVLFCSGLADSKLAQVLSEFTENLFFADPILEHGIPRLLNSYQDLELYANKVHGVLDWVPGRRLSRMAEPLRAWNQRILRSAVQRASMVVLPYYGFYRYAEGLSGRELEGKTVITSTAYDDRVSLLKERGVEVIIDTTPKILERVVGVSVLEAMAIVALQKASYQITDDDLLEILCDQRMEPRLLYPAGSPRRVNRFAFVMLPLSQEHEKKAGPGGMFTEVASHALRHRMKRLVPPSPPSVYSSVRGIRSPAGVEAEGWLISLGLTPEEMNARSPQSLERQLAQAARLAKRLGAQVMGISLLTRDLGSVAVNLAKHADIPVTTGNSYMASTALWAAADAVRRMGFIKLKRGKILKAKTMVVGATGDVGSICCRLLAKAFEEVTLVSRNIAKLLALQESIQEESPGVRLKVSTRADKYLADMDVIVAASAGALRSLDISSVKPGCVITDLTRPMLFSPEDAARRPDVLVIKSGEIFLPGEQIRMKGFGLPPNVVPAGLAETIILALEGRFEIFTVGSETRWEKVREIYRLGLKHGLQLAAISGVNGVVSDEDIARVRELALRRRRTASSGPKAAAPAPGNGPGS